MYCLLILFEIDDCREALMQVGRQGSHNLHIMFALESYHKCILSVGPYLVQMLIL